VSAGKAKEEQDRAEDRVQAVLGVAEPKVIEKAKELRPDLFE
jgi:hypothetical protein